MVPSLTSILDSARHYSARKIGAASLATMIALGTLGCASSKNAVPTPMRAPPVAAATIVAHASANMPQPPQWDGYHTIVKGDTLSGIAKQYNVPDSRAAVFWTNMTNAPENKGTSIDVIAHPENDKYRWVVGKDGKCRRQNIADGYSDILKIGERIFINVPYGDKDFEWPCAKKETCKRNLPTTPAYAPPAAPVAAPTPVPVAPTYTPSTSRIPLAKCHTTGWVDVRSAAPAPTPVPLEATKPVQPAAPVTITKIDKTNITVNLAPETPVAATTPDYTPEESEIVPPAETTKPSKGRFSIGIGAGSGVWSNEYSHGSSEVDLSMRTAFTQISLGYDTKDTQFLLRLAKTVGRELESDCGSWYCAPPPSKLEATTLRGDLMHRWFGKKTGLSSKVAVQFTNVQFGDNCCGLYKDEENRFIDVLPLGVMTGDARGSYGVIHLGASMQQITTTEVGAGQNSHNDLSNDTEWYPLLDLSFRKYFSEDDNSRRGLLALGDFRYMSPKPISSTSDEPLREGAAMQLNLGVGYAFNDRFEIILKGGFGVDESTYHAPVVTKSQTTHSNLGVFGTYHLPW